MKNAGIDKKVRQVAMHHKSEESQNVYTEPTVTEVTSALSQATSTLEQGMVLPMKTEVGLLTNRDELRKKDIQFIKLDMLQL